MKRSKSIFEEIESWASDDLRMLEEFGSEAFATGELRELAQVTDLRIVRFERWQRVNLTIGVSSLVWLAVAFGAAFFGYIAVASWAVRLFPLTLFVFVAGAFWLRYRLGSLGTLHFLKDMLRTELRHRARKFGTAAKD